jgi:hypothetical protein
MKTDNAALFLMAFAIICIFAVLIISCGGSNYRPPNPNDPAEQRLFPALLRSRQIFAAQNVVLYPRQKIQPYQWAARTIALGGHVEISDLPVGDAANKFGYWYWPLVVHLHYQGQPGAEAWFEKWLRAEKSLWRIPSALGSMNHQAARGGGFYFAAKILGVERAAEISGSHIYRHRERIVSVVNGPHWWDYTNRNESVEHPSAGNNEESFASRHYLGRDLEYLMVLADYAEPDVAQMAAQQLDIAIAHMRPAVQRNGILSEIILPRHRGNKDTTDFREAWEPFNLTCHPGQTPVLLYLLFGTEWRKEFQDVAQSHENWGSYIFIGGKNWRPLK